jgi:pimeloyl-ACP methyl ester carboxylesterase
MSVIGSGPRFHLIIAAFLALTATMSSQTPQTPAPVSHRTSSFTILVHGARFGTERVTVTRNAGGWQISAGGVLRPPIDLVTSKFELSYGPDWQPRHLAIEATLRGQPLALTTSFGLTSAISDVVQGGQRGSVTRDVSPRAIVLPGNFYGAYEALALRLGSAGPGTRFQIFVAPEREIPATVTGMTMRRLATPEGTVDLRQFDLSFGYPGDPMAIEVWIDGQDRLARIVRPADGLTVVRDDLSSVLAREVKIRNPRDEDLFIPASGFNLGATITTASGSATRSPAVVLVGGVDHGPQDRDYGLYGVPIFGQLAGVLSDAGYFVVRFDRRGSGQSGGRVENATLIDYANDVIGIVNWLRRRRDVDQNRIAVIGYGEGGPIALTAASREERIRGIGLLAAPGRPGRDFALEQQVLALDRMKQPEADRQAKIALQTRVLDAVMTGKGWEGIATELRYQADTPWFRSWLTFDPARIIERLEQPMLILHGALDQETPVAHAERLDTLARARRKIGDTHTRKIVVPGVNHLLVRAETGLVDEYTTLSDRTLAADVGTAIVSWLNEALPPRR